MVSCQRQLPRSESLAHGGVYQIFSHIRLPLAASRISASLFVDWTCRAEFWFTINKIRNNHFPGDLMRNWQIWSCRLPDQSPDPAGAVSFGSASTAGFFFPNIRAPKILISYRTIKGRAIIIWVTTSGGVSMAALTKKRSSAYFLFFLRKFNRYNAEPG